MCLIINNEKTKEIEKKLKKKGKLVMYKVVKKVENQLIPMFYGLRRFYFRPGWVRSNRLSTCLTPDEYDFETVHEGIHVYHGKKHATFVRDFHNNDAEYAGCLILLPVIVYQEDFLAAGEKSDAVFHKVYLPPADYYALLMPTKKGKK